MKTPGEYQHLYFLSNEKIKEGDWIFKALDNTPVHYKDIADGLRNPAEYGYKKIIYTTDSSLDITGDRIPVINDFANFMCKPPQPSLSFLEVYVKEYNKGNQIKNVIVEYEDNGLTPKGNTITIF